MVVVAKTNASTVMATRAASQGQRFLIGTVTDVWFIDDSSKCVR